MYFVDKDKLTQKITYLQKLTEDYNDNKRNLYAFERIGQMLKIGRASCRERV